MTTTRQNWEQNHNYNTALTTHTSRTLVFYNLPRFNKRMSDAVPLNNFSTSEVTFVVGDTIRITSRESQFFENIGKIIGITESQLKVVFQEDKNFVRFVTYSYATLLQSPLQSVSAGNVPQRYNHVSIKNLHKDDREIMFLHLAEHVATMLIHTLGVDENLEERLETFVSSVKKSIQEFTNG